MKKLFYIAVVAMLVLSVFTGCSDENADETDFPSELFAALDGSYVELFPVIFDDAYDDVWSSCIADVIASSGYENVDADSLLQYYVSQMSGTVIGEEAVSAYSESPSSAAFNCDFQNDITTLIFDADNMSITGIDDSGERAFSYTYSYYGESSITGSAGTRYVYAADSDDAGEFKYFSMSDNTMDTTYHIEFSYGSDLDALSTWYSGKYAYWCASGIAADYDDDLVKDVIKLFCEENLYYYVSYFVTTE